ncbi:unnamed protein product [Closterium sp. Yama58-4]|nr:unnamed protein product [Closterium sp. Yama58-4]
MLYSHYLPGFQLPAFQNGSWAVPSALPTLSPLPLRHEGADSAATDANAEMPRVDSSTHINSLVAQYSFAQAGAAAAAAAAAACASSPISPSQLVSPRTGWPHFAACAPSMGPMGPVSYAPGFGAIRSPKQADGSASAGGSPSPSSHLPSLLESPLQSEVLPAESDGESFCKLELPTGQVDGEAETKTDQSRRLVFPSERAAADGAEEEADNAEQDLRVTKGTRRAMQLWLEGGAEGDVQGMGPFDWLEEPSGAEDATGLPHWVLAELGEGGAGKKSGEAVEEEVYRVLFRADSMESATGEHVNSAATTLKNEQHVTTPLHETPVQAHEPKKEQNGDESTPAGTNKAVTDTPAGEEQGSNPVSDAGSADFMISSIGDSVSGGLVDKPSAQVLEDSSTDDIWHDLQLHHSSCPATRSSFGTAMGISGLLPLLKSVTRRTHIREYAGRRVAIDTYSWLHRASYSCSQELCQGTPCTRHIQYCMNKVKLLRDNGVIPVLVFDGGKLPSKSQQESKREKSRRENLERAEQLLLKGKRNEARECFQKAVDITPAIAHQLIKVLRQEHVEYVVAPYEADAQMAFLCSSGLVHAVITEDSDLIAYSCPRVFFKMDPMGHGDEIVYANIVQSQELALADFTPQMVLEMCILSGCDYLDSLPKVGLKTAHDWIRRHRDYRSALAVAKLNGRVVPEEYEAAFAQALLTFLHHRVYHVANEHMTHVNPLPASLGPDTDLSFLGPYPPQRACSLHVLTYSLSCPVLLDCLLSLSPVLPFLPLFSLLLPLLVPPFFPHLPLHFPSALTISTELTPSLVRAIALGYVDPITYEPFDAEPIPKPLPPARGGPGRSPLQLPVQKNKLSKYFLPTAPAAKKPFQPPRSSPVTPPAQSAFEPSRPEAAAEPGPAGSANQPRGNSSSGRGGRSVRTSAVGKGCAGPTEGECLAGAENGSGEPMLGEDLVQFMAGTVLEEERQQQQPQQQQQQRMASGPRAAVARVFQRFTPPRSIAEAGTTPEPPLQRRQPYGRAAARATGDRQENTPTEWDQFVFRGNERTQAEGEEAEAGDGGERSEVVLRRGRDLDGERDLGAADLDADLDELLLPPAFDLVSDVPGSHEVRQVGRRPGGWRAGGWMGMRGAATGGRARGRGGGVGIGGGRVVGVGVGGAGSSRQQAEAIFDSPKRMLGSGRGVQGRGVRGRMGAAHVVVRQEMSCSTCVGSEFLLTPPAKRPCFDDGASAGDAGFFSVTATHTIRTTHTLSHVQAHAMHSVDIDPFADPWSVGHTSDPLLPHVLPSMSPFGPARPFSVREMQGEAEAAEEEEEDQQQEKEGEEESPFFRPARSSVPFAHSPLLPPSHCSAAASLRRRPTPSPLPPLHPRRTTTGLFTPTTLASPASAAAGNPFASHVYCSRMPGAAADGGFATPAATTPATTAAAPAAAAAVADTAASADSAAAAGPAQVEEGSFWPDRGSGAADGADPSGADVADAVEQADGRGERECGDENGRDGFNGAGGGLDRLARHGRAGSAVQAEVMEEDPGLGRAGFNEPGRQGLVYRMPVAGVPPGRGLNAGAAGVRRAAGGDRGRGLGGVTGAVRGGDRKRNLVRGSAFFRGNAAEACEDRDAEDAGHAEGPEGGDGGNGDGEGERCGGGGVDRNRSGDVGDDAAEDVHMRSRSSSMSGLSFATDVSHVLRYSAVGKDAMGKVAAKLASFRHTPAENKPRGRMGRRLGGSKRPRSLPGQQASAFQFRLKDAKMDHFAPVFSSFSSSSTPFAPSKLTWHPHPDRYLLAVCVRGQVNNRIGCLYRHLILAALLNRTLLVPARLPSLTPLLCQRGASGRVCPSYPLPLFWDLNHTRRCLGAASVIRSDEFAARFGRPVEVNHMRCWHGPEGLCRPTYSIVKKNCLVGTALSYVAENLRKKFGGQRVASDVVHAMLLNGSSLQPHSAMPAADRENAQSHSGVLAADESTQSTEGLSSRSLSPAPTNVGEHLLQLTGRTLKLSSSSSSTSSAASSSALPIHPTAIDPIRMIMLHQPGAVSIPPTATASALCLPRFVHVSDVLRAYGPLGESVRVLAVGDLVGTAVLGLPHRYALLQEKARRYSGGRNLWLDKDFVRPPGGRWLGSSGSGGLRDWLSIFQFLPGCRNTAAIVPPPAVFQRAQAIIRSLFGAETVDAGGASSMADSLESGTPLPGSYSSAAEVGAREVKAGESGALTDADLPVPTDLPAFLAVHWRRGDFLQFCARSGPPGFCFYSPVQAAQCAADVARRNGLVNVYVATDADDKEFQEFRETLGPEFTVARLPSSPSPLLPDPYQDPLLGLRQGAFLKDAASLLYTILDKVICVYSTVFLATPSSTLSNDVARIREGLGIPAAMAAAAAVGAEEEAVGESAEVRKGVDFGESTGVEEGRDGALLVADAHASGGEGSVESEDDRGSLSGGEGGMWHGKLVWTPQPDRFLLAVCLRGQVNNRIGCLYRHLILAALLNRTLLVPPVLLSTSLAYCKHGLSGSPCPSIPLPLIWDLAHTRTCLGGDTVLRTDEFATRFGRPLEVHHMRCWHGPEATCPMGNPGLLKNCLVNDTAQAGGGRRRRLGGVSGMRKLSRAGVGVGTAAADTADAVRGWFGEKAMMWVRGSRRRKLQQQQQQQQQRILQGTEGAPNRSPPLYTVQSFANSPMQISAAPLHLLPHQLSPDVHISANATASAVCFPRFVHVRDILRTYGPLSASVPVLAVGDLVFTAFLGLSDRYEPFKERLFRYKRWREREEASQERQGNSTSNFDGMQASSSSQVILESDFLGPAGGRWLGSAGKGGLREWRSVFHFLPGCPVPVPILPPKEVIEDGMRLAQALFGGGERGAGAAGGVLDVEGGGYLAVHWRRSDFKDYCVWSGPSGFCFYSAQQAGKCAADVAQRNGLRNIYVASDANVEQFEEFQKAAGIAFKVIRYPDNPSAFLTTLTSEPLISSLPASIDREEASLLLHMLLDKLICVRSTVFLATMSSTLSNDVARMREGFGVPAALAAAADPGSGNAMKMAATSDAPSDVGLEFVVSSGVEERRDGGLCEGEKVWRPLEGLFGWMKDMKAKRIIEHSAGEWRR